MKDRIYFLRERVVKITQILTGKGILVTQRGADAYVESDKDGRPVRVNLPYIGDHASDDLLLAIEGFLDHEVAHILFSDFTLLGKSMREGEKLGKLHNILEDTLIERLMPERFPGSGHNLLQMHDFFCRRYTDPVLEEAQKSGNPKHIEGALFVPYIRSLAKQPVFVRYMADKRGMIPDLVAKLDDLAPRIAAARSTQDTYDLAVEVLKRLERKPPSKGGGEGKGKPDKKDAKSPKSKPGADPGADSDDEGKGAKGEGPDGSPSKSGKAKKGDEKAKDESTPEKDESEKGDAKGKPKKGDDPEKDKDSSERDEEPGEDDSGKHDPDSDDYDPDSDDPLGDETEKDGGGGDGKGEREDDEERSGKGDGAGDGEEEGDGDEKGAAPGDESEEEEGGAPSGSLDGAHGDEEEGSRGEGGEVDINDLSGDADPTGSEGLEKAKGFDDAMSMQITGEARKSALGAPYLPFTRDLDRIEKLELTSRDREFYESLVKDLDEEVLHMVGVMQKDLERAIAARSKVCWNAGKRSGRLHGAALSRLAAGDVRVFRTKEEHTSKDVAVSLVVDLSGSMHGSKVMVACKAAYALSQTLERIGIKHEVIGFTTVPVPGALNAEMSMAMVEGRRDFSRVEPIYMPVLKEFDERLNSGVKPRFVAAAGRVTLRNNVDGESVEYAAMRLAQRREKGKIMIVLSDGAPHALGDSYAQSQHLERVVRELPQRGIKVVGLGVQTTTVERYYPRNMVVNRLEDLPGVVMRQLRSLLLD